MLSVDELRLFFCGEWQLSRSLRFRRGGGVGTVSGSASFKPWPQGVAPGHQLLYAEHGTMKLEGIPSPMSVSKKYAFDCSKLPLNVNFVDEASRTSAGDAGAPGADVLGGFFHSLDFGATRGEPEPEPELLLPHDETTQPQQQPLRAVFCHLCAPDTYSGSMVVDVRQDEFTWSWRVTGPQKDGEIVSRYTRSSPGGSADDVAGEIEES